MSRNVSRLPPRLIIGLVSVFGLILLIHFAGVALLRHFVEKELHPPLPRGTSIGEVHLNLFSGLLKVEDFEFRDDTGLRMRAARLDVDVSPWRLLSGKLHVEDLVLSSGYLRVERRDDGTFDLGLPASTEQEPSAETGAPPFSLAGMRLEKFTIDYRDGELSSLIRAEKLKVGAYSALLDSQQVPVDWALTWDGRPIHGKASLALSPDAFSAKGQVQTGLLDLGRAEQLARQPKTLNGEAAFDGTFEWVAPTLQLGGGLKAPKLDYAVGGRKVALGGLEFPDFVFKLVTEPQLSIDFSPQEGGRIASWKTEIEDQQIDGRALEVGGTISYSGDQVINGRDLAYSLETVNWQSGARRVSLTGVVLRGRAQQSLKGDTPLPALNATFSATDIGYEDTEAALALQLNKLQLIDLALSPLEEGARRLGGRLLLAGSTVTQADTRLGWNAVDATLGGQVSKQGADIATDLSLSGLRVANPAFANGPLSLDRIVAKGLALGGPTTAFDQLRLEGIALPAAASATELKVAGITLDGGSFAEQAGVDLGRIVIDGLQTGVIRDKAGEWRHVMSGGAAAQSTPQQPSPPAGEAVKPAAGDAGLRWKIAGLRLSGDSHITLADALNPGMKPVRYAVETIELGALSSSEPGRDTPFEVTLRPDKYSEFSLKGVVRPLASDLYLKAEGHLHGFGLSAVNGLVANDLGHRFLEGQLDDDFTITIDSDRLDMGNALSMSSLQVEEIEGKEGPPLGTAIALLEDRDGNIKLELPVAGDLNDPDFRVLGALNPIIMKAVAGTAALAIQPLGSVLLVGGLLANQALKVTFEPALFAPGSTELDAAAREYLGQLAGKLAEKPKLKVRVCGVVAEVERRKDKKGVYIDKAEELLAVAQSRADAARDYLRKKGAGKTQLRACRPKLDAKADAKPRVDIAL